MKPYTSIRFTVHDFHKDYHGPVLASYKTLSGAKSGLRALQRAILRPRKYGWREKAVNPWVYEPVNERKKVAARLSILKTITTSTQIK